jgi:tetratricopeptide (TPR) repeat protein
MKRTYSTLLALTLTVSAAPVAFAQGAKPKPKPAQNKPKPAPAKPAPAAKPAEPAANAQGAKTWALLVGVSKYANPTIASLRFPAADATAVKDALVDPNLGGVPTDHVKLLTDADATRSGVLGAVDSFLKAGVKPGDRVLLFLAGHGVAKGVGPEARSYFLPNDVQGFKKEQLAASAVDLKELSEKLSGLPAAQFVVFMDACREDPIPGRGIKGNPMTDVMARGVQVPGAATFFACSVGQRAFEDPTLQHGVFTNMILEAVQKAGPALVRPGTGEIDLGLLASYVKGRVEEWAKKTTESGAFEVEQTPDLVTLPVSEPLTVVAVKPGSGGGALTPASFKPEPPSLYVASQPAGAQVLVDGRPVGAAPVSVTLSSPGEHTVSLQAPGFKGEERKVKAFEGYGVQVDFSLPPGAAAGGRGQVADAAGAFFKKAQDAEKSGQWEQADGAYALAYGADADFAAAYEAQADLRRRRNRDADAVDSLATQVKKSSAPTARAYGQLARAYAEYSLKARLLDESAAASGGGDKQGGDKPKNPLGGLGGLFGKKKGGGDDKKPDDKGASGGPERFVRPADFQTAATLARAAADEAVKLDASSADALTGLGFALLATESGDPKKRKNRSDAEGAFGKALTLDPKNADAHYALGYCIRFYAQDMDPKKQKAEMDADLDRAIGHLKDALALRPGFYEAHRELAYCHHLKGELEPARKEYEMANANRGDATDEREVAAVNVSLGAVLKQMSLTASGTNRAGLEAASLGYITDARDLDPKLEGALRYLIGARLGGRITNFVPNEVQGVLGPIQSKLDGVLRKIDVPGLPGLPRIGF